MSKRLSIISMILCASLGCVHQPKANKASSGLEIRTYPPGGPSINRKDYIAKSSKAMVTAAHPLASQAGQKVLKNGGNAVDAAVAVSFVISVVRPQSTGIGGGGFLIHHSKDGRVRSFDFREKAPLTASRDMYLDSKGQPKEFSYKGQSVPRASVNGHLSAGVPGLVAGLWDIHQKLGKMPWAQLLDDAIKIAEEGFPVYPNLAKAIQRRAKVMKVFDSTRDIYFPKGRALATGDLLVQKDLAVTLKAIASQGKKAFYSGSIAKKIVAEMKAHKGLISFQDLKKYETVERNPVTGSYAGHKIYSMPPPSSGGIHIVQMLNVLENFPQNKLKFFSPDYLHALVETMRQAYADRAVHLGDPDYYKVPQKALTSQEYAKSIFSRLDLKKAGDSEKIGPSDLTPYEPPSTTHFSVVDSEGQAVSSTQTVNYTFGSGVVVPDTGILLNDEMDDFSIKPATPNAFGLIGFEANKIEAGKRMLSSMSPTIVTKDDKVVAVLGSPGGSRIINATLQVILNRLRFNLSPEDSVHAFRIHHQWRPDQIYHEINALIPETEQELTSRGFKLKSSSWPIGDVQAIFRDGDQWIGVSDTRSDGRPVGL